MKRALVTILFAAVTATAAPAATKAATKGATNVVAKPALANDPVEKEYQRLLELDDKVHEEIDKLITENAAFKEKGAGLAEAALALKIEQRRQPVREAWQEFLKLNPRHVRGLLAYGSFLNDLGEGQEAAKQWEKAREFAPSNPAAWNNLAKYHASNGPTKKALEYFAKAIELDPRQAVYHHNLGTTVFFFRKDAMDYYKITEQQVFDRALQHYAEAMKLAPEDFVLASDVAQAYYGIRPPRHEAAVGAWELALKLVRDDAEREGVHLHLARVLANAGKFDEARKHLAVVKLPNLQETKVRVAATLERMAKPGTEPSTPAPVKEK